MTYFFSTSGGHTENVENSFVGRDAPALAEGRRRPLRRRLAAPPLGPLRLHRRPGRSAALGRLVTGTLPRGSSVVERGASPRVVRAAGRRQPAARRPSRARSCAGAFGLNDTWAYFRTISPPRAEAATPLRRPLPGDPSTGGTTTDGLRALAVLAAAVHARTPHVAGTIAPARTGSRVRLQRLTAGRWETVRRGRILAAGRYEIAAPQPGEYRVVYGEDAGPSVRVG